MQASPYWPFVVLLVSMAVVIFMISKLKIHAFICLMIAAMIAGLLTLHINVPGGGSHLVKAIETPMIEFGNTAGKIAWVIALASIMGTAMLESGAAERIVSAIVSLLGEKRAPVALLISGFLLAIPIFLDTVFFLMVPLAIALVKRTGKDYLLYILAISGGGLITHCLVPPTPGPLIMAENMRIDLGVTIIAGLALGILPAWGVYKVAQYRNKKFVLPLRVAVDQSDSTGSLPRLLYSIAPILLPLLLISMSSVSDVLMEDSKPVWIDFIGNKNMAMAIGTAIALWVWARHKNYTGVQLWEACARPLEIAGVIILITAAGGAFGAMLGHSGIGGAIKELTTRVSVNYILLGWMIAAIMKVAQGSSTVAMITTSSIMYALIQSDDAPAYHPVYVLIAIAFGSMFVSWMNDSGFWVISRMSGMTTVEALKNFTVMTGCLAIMGLVELLIVSRLLPLI